MQGLIRRGQKSKKSRASHSARVWPRALAFLGVSLLLVLALGVSWLYQPMGFQIKPTDSNSPSAGGAVLDLSIESGTSPRGVAQAVVQAGADTSAQLLLLWFKASGQARAIKAGSYEISLNMSPKMLLNMLVRGEETLRSLTVVEGWNFKQLRQAMAKADSLKPSTLSISDAQIMKELGRPQLHPEGRFSPDTYTYAKGATDLSVLKRAMAAMDRHLDRAWAQRHPSAAVKTPEEALILASIVEKETGKAADRAMISGVFNNRLRIGMRLQTDPTVIYGLGSTFDGNLRRSDLRQDTPYNTYTRDGLPPSPIAMPGKAALMAAVQPAATQALYFVARGDGSSHFSQELSEHNRAVNRYQRGMSLELAPSR